MGQPLEPGLAPNTITATPPAPPPVVINNQPPQQYFTAADLEAARKQEKDKLYDRITKAEEQLQAFKSEADQWRSEREAAQLAATKAAQDAADAQRKEAEAKMSAEELISSRQREMDDQMTAWRTEVEAQKAFLAKEQQYISLRGYIQQRVAEEMAAGTIADEFLDYISGETKEEVDASITKAKEKTDSIVRATFGGQPRTPGVAPTGFGPTGPLDTFQGQRSFSKEDIDAMSMADFARFREQAGIDKAGNNQGMFR